MTSTTIQSNSTNIQNLYDKLQQLSHYFQEDNLPLQCYIDLLCVLDEYYKILTPYMEQKNIPIYNLKTIQGRTIQQNSLRHASNVYNNNQTTLDNILWLFWSDYYHLHWHLYLKYEKKNYGH